MKRHFFISDNLDDLDRIEVELERRGINKPQIHVLSKDDAGVDTHKHLHNIEAVFKQDVVHGTMVGATIGLLAAAAVMAIAYLTKLPETFTWMPFYFLSIVMFGFVTWSGGFYGIQTPHKDFRRYRPISGRHHETSRAGPSSARRGRHRLCNTSMGYYGTTKFQRHYDDDFPLNDKQHYVL